MKISIENTSILNIKTKFILVHPTTRVTSSSISNTQLKTFHYSGLMSIELSMYHEYQPLQVSHKYQPLKVFQV